MSLAPTRTTGCPVSSTAARRAATRARRPLESTKLSRDTSNVTTLERPQTRDVAVEHIRRSDVELACQPEDQ